MFNFKHGHRSAPLGSPERRAYDAWRNLRRRCTNRSLPNFEDYGGRGISFDPRWNEYDQFLQDMGLPPEGYSIERRENDGPYSKANCIWAPRIVQANNKRNNRFVEFNGERKTVSQWGHERGIRPLTLLKRLDHGWPIDRAMAEGRFHRFGKFVPSVTIT